MSFRWSQYVGLVAAICLIAWPVRAAAQSGSSDVRYWPLREIYFPVNVDDVRQQTPAPTRLRFYVATRRDRFTLISERAINDLDTLDAERNRKGFRYVSSTDGECEFALQFVYGDGTVSPRTTELVAQQRVVFDSKPPIVTARLAGSTGIEWEVTDENLRPEGSVVVETRWQGEQKWHPIAPRSFRARDSYSWSNLTPSQPLEVRVIGRDRAGLETVSRVMTLPSGSGSIAREPREELPRNGDLAPRRDEPRREEARAGFGGPDDFTTSSIRYVNTRSLTIESKLTRVTRSGVRRAHLWVDDGRGGWKLNTSENVSIAPGETEPVVRIPYNAGKDGLHKFIVIPENGAGGKQNDPLANDPAQYLIEVDTERPFVQIKNVRVLPASASATNRPRVEIEWNATDRNLAAEAIKLEYATEKTASVWKEIHAGRLPNTGRYTWEVDDEAIWKFFIKVSAKDKASNEGEQIYEKEIMIDLDTPRAVIEKVQPGAGTGRPSLPTEERNRRSESRPVEPVTPRPTETEPTKPYDPPSIPTLPPR